MRMSSTQRPSRRPWTATVEDHAESDRYGQCVDESAEWAEQSDRSRTRSQDVRARRTRERLVSAYLQLLDTTAAPLSVTQVVRAAGVNRSSFYAHFADLGDLGLDVLDTALDAIYAAQAQTVQARSQDDLRTTAVEQILQAVAANAPTLRLAVHHNRAATRYQIGQAIQRNANELLHQLPGWEDTRPAATHLLAIYLSHGWAGVICAWLADELTSTQSELADQLVALNPDGPRFLQASSTLN